MSTYIKQLNRIIRYLIIMAIAILLAFNYQLFVVENNFAPAGLNGIATMIQYKTGFSIGYMSLIINVPLCILAYFFVQKRFAKYSLCFCVTYSLVFIYLQKLGLEEFQYKSMGHDTIFPAILSGVISGVVYGFCFRNNASTGGTDIISKYISKKKPELNFFWVTFVINSMVAIVSFFVYATKDIEGNMIYDYNPVCLCITYSFLSSYVGSAIIRGTKSACKFTIITSHPNEITAEISEKLHHGSTQIDAMGSFTHEKKTVLLCVINKHQIIELNKVLKKYDNTFSFAETVNEIYGHFLK